MIVDISRMPVIAISRVRGIGVALMRQHVDGGAQPLHLLLVLDAEALLLVDDDQPQVLDPDVGVEQAVGAHDDVDRALGQLGDDLLGLLVGLEAAQALDHDREAAHPLAERRHVLGDQQRRRHQDRDLLAVLDGLERRAHGDLGLAVAHVAADQAVHRHRLRACRTSTSSTVVSWSGVSVKGKASSSSRCHGVSGPKR